MCDQHRSVTGSFAPTGHNEIAQGRAQRHPGSYAIALGRPTPQFAKALKKTGDSPRVFLMVCLFWLIPYPLLLNAYYPVGFAYELGPALHLIHSIGVDRLPRWTHWLLAKLHVRLSRSPVSLFRIAVDASQYAVGPGRRSTLSSRNNVVNREFLAARLLSTVLATHLVTLENVASAESNCLGRHRIELRQRDDFRDADALAYRLNERLITIRNQLAPIAPVIQLVIDGIDNPCGVVPQYDQSTRNCRHVDWLPATVQHQCGTLKRWAQADRRFVVVKGCCDGAHA